MVGVLSLACSNPAGDRLTEAQTLQEAGDLPGAAAAYEAVAMEWPESEEAKLASLHAPLVHRELLQQRVDEEDWITAADHAAHLQSGPWSGTLNPDIDRLRSSSEPFDTTMGWHASADQAPGDRVILALSLVSSEEHAWLHPSASSWLADNVGEALAPLCSGRLASLDEVDDLEALQDIATACGVIVQHAPESEAATASQAAIDGPIAQREEAIKASPAYRTEAALAACRAWNAWLASERAAIRSLARRGKIEAAENRAYRFQDQVESRGQTELFPHLEYLRNRLNRLESQQARISLVRRISRDCE